MRGGVGGGCITEKRTDQTCYCYVPPPMVRCLSLLVLVAPLRFHEDQTSPEREGNDPDHAGVRGLRPLSQREYPDGYRRECKLCAPVPGLAERWDCWRGRSAEPMC